MSVTADSLDDLVVTDRERLLIAEGRMGIEVERFLKSEVGRLLHGRAKQEIEEAKAELMGCDPNTFWGRRKIKKLQNRALIAQWFMSWCVEAIMDGRNAEIQLQENGEP